MFSGITGCHKSVRFQWKLSEDLHQMAFDKTKVEQHLQLANTWVYIATRDHRPTCSLQQLM